MAATDLKTVRMPDVEDMRQRLETVIEDDYVRRHFLPHLLEGAGRELAGIGVVNMINFAIIDYTDGMPPAMATVMWMQMRSLVTALVDDEDVRKDAFEFLDEVDKTVSGRHGTTR